MSYETDAMRALSASLRNTEGLKYTLKEFNSNINVLKALTIELAKANELQERQKFIYRQINRDFRLIGYNLENK